jgi:hypothetical protein
MAKRKAGFKVKMLKVFEREKMTIYHIKKKTIAVTLR